MRSYRFARRSFLAGVGGAVGLKIMLRNMEAMAAGATSPPRFLLTHFPVGTLKQRFMPTGSGSTYTASPITKPFEDAGLRNDMTVFWGFSDAHLSCPGGGGHESGTTFMSTCCSANGTRNNGGEGDDGTAGGPSFDQVFLKNVMDLQRPGKGYVNAICDARVDSNETSTRCLSYGYTAQPVNSANPGGSITEYQPLQPELSPLQLYGSLFKDFMPSAPSGSAGSAAAIKALKMRKSVLDFALNELNQLKTLAPGSEAAKIDLHAQAIRNAEMQLDQAIQNGGMGTSGCTAPTAPDKSLTGKMGNASYNENTVTGDDAPTHKLVAEAHGAIILAAFQCDLIRVASFQFSPGTNHVSFKGLWPNDPNRIAMHHPISHEGAFQGSGATADPASLSADDRNRYEFLAACQVWYNTRLAELLTKFKQAKDSFGNSLLDYTVVPFVTEVAQSNHTRSPKPGFLFGGTKLGLKHGTFQNFAQTRPQVDLYLACAQALLKNADPKSGLANERFWQFNKNAAVIDGLWAAPT